MLSINLSTKLIIALLVPFIGTSLGSAMVFLLRKQVKEKLLKLLLGFASGVMIAASVWSLLLPAMNSYENGDFRKWFVPALGFIIGIIFLFLLDILVPHMHVNKKEEGLNDKKISSTLKMLLAITIHNIPEGLAVGLVIASAINGQGTTEQAALILAIGIAIQNFPEGAIVSMPLKETGVTKLKAFWYGVLSGIVEPLAALIALLITSQISIILPYALSFAAGAMIYVVADELIPQANEGNKSSLATIGVSIGFVLMMILDVTLG